MISICTQLFYFMTMIFVMIIFISQLALAATSKQYKPQPRMPVTQSAPNLSSPKLLESLGGSKKYAPYYPTKG